jgi:hypothetical protein
MKKEGFLDTEAVEANKELDKKMNDNSPIPHGAGEKVVNATTEANLEIQEFFYGENRQDEILPTYINENTPAIKITGNNK